MAIIKQLLKLFILLPFILFHMTVYTFAEKDTPLSYAEVSKETSSQQIEKNIAEEADFPEILYFIGFIPVVFVSALLVMLIKAKDTTN